MGPSFFFKIKFYKKKKTQEIQDPKLTRKVTNEHRRREKRKKKKKKRKGNFLFYFILILKNEHARGNFVRNNKEFLFIVFHPIFFLN